VPLSPPRPIDALDELAAFDCGVKPLDEWLSKQALRNEAHTARTYVVADGRRVVGYYNLATGAAGRSAMPRKIRHGLPDPVPVMLLGRLAVDKRYQSLGLGKGLLRDGLQRTLQVSKQAGVRAMLVHAIDDDARRFYARYGFAEFPAGSLTLFLPLGVRCTGALAVIRKKILIIWLTKQP
jgi:GNAT superfamily N-acetyltransferase